MAEETVTSEVLTDKDKAAKTKRIIIIVAGILILITAAWYLSKHF